MWSLLLPVLSVFVISHGEAAKILSICPVPAPSHYILCNALLKGLADRGHDVTMISPFEEKNPPKTGSYRDVVLTGFKEQFNKTREHMNLFENADKSFILMLPFMVQMMQQMTEDTLNHTAVQKLIHSNEKFDVVIIEEFLNFAHKGFAAHFDAPLIVLSTVGSNAWINNLVGNPEPYSYVPDIFLSYSNRMTFWQRLGNTLLRVASDLWYQKYVIPRHEVMHKKYFPNNPPLKDVLYNVSIVLLNSHLSINPAVPRVPNMIDIGGYHVQPTKQLPEDLQNYLDNAKNGVVYFSMGSNLRSSEMPMAKRKAILATLGKLKENVLWKFEEDLPDKPANVKISKWLPQQEILGHPNVKLFITHGGFLSTTETVYQGKPVLAIPIMGDQKMNALTIVNAGFGLKLDFHRLNEENFMESIQELLKNPKYAQNAKVRSVLFHDRHVKPMDTATYWVEYVIRHKGAPHLRVAGLDLPFYKYMLLDVMAVLSIGLLISIVVSYKILKCMKYLLIKNTKKVKVN